jgi:Fe-S-cluster containining protein
MKRRLPLLTERSMAQMKASRAELSSEFDAHIPAVSCKPGCSACCSYPLYVSILEGMTIYKHLTDRGMWSPMMRKKLEAHSEKTFDLTSEVWLISGIACPLLVNDRCSVYAARPFGCRTLYAISDPEYCKPSKILDGRFLNRDSVMEKFLVAEAMILARHGLALLGIPISRAILLGEKIMTGASDLEHFLDSAMKELPR